MSMIDASFSMGASSVRGTDEVTAQLPIEVHSCSRLGRVANPPSFSFADWFRSARRRCPCLSAAPDAADNNDDDEGANTCQ
jgi:hypothetical protein